MADLTALAALLPPYANDIALNLASLVAETQLGDEQKCGFRRLGPRSGDAGGREGHRGRGGGRRAVGRGEGGRQAAAAIMAQNNVYFRAVALMKNQEYRRSGPASACASSPIRACPGSIRPLVRRGLCDPRLRRLPGRPRGVAEGAGVDPVVIQTALRIAAVVHAASRVVAGEAAAS